MAQKKQLKKRTVLINKKRSTQSKHLSIYLGLFIGLFAFLLYSNTLGHDFAYDDRSAISENYVIQQGLEGIPTIWTTHYRYGYQNAGPELYRPLTQTMFAVEWAIAPNNPLIHHFINVLLYGITGFLLFVTLMQILKNQLLISFLTALFFVAHPVHTEVVANIKSRDEILSFLFFLLALKLLWNYAQSNHRKTLIAAISCYTLSLFSKESAITFLAIFSLSLYFFSEHPWKKIIKLTLPFLIPVGFFLLIRYHILGTMGNANPPTALQNLLLSAESYSEQLATTFFLLGKYLVVLLFPYSLNSDAGFGTIPIYTWGNWKVLLSVCLHFSLVAFALYQFKKRSILSFAILFYCLTFSIYTNFLLLIGSSYGERFLYAPSLGFSLAIAFLIASIAHPQKTQPVANIKAFIIHYRPALLVVMLLVLLYSFKTIDRNKVWKDSLQLFGADLKASPQSVQLNYGYGVETLKKSATITDNNKRLALIGNAQKSLITALKLYPKHSDAYGQLGLAYYLDGNLEKAMENYKLSLDFQTNNPLVHTNMGMIYYLQNNLPEAKAAYQKAIAQSPRMGEAYRNLAGIYIMEKQYELAIPNYLQALQFDSENADIHYFLGTAYQEIGDTEKAKPYLEKAYQLDPSLKNELNVK